MLNSDGPSKWPLLYMMNPLRFLISSLLLLNLLFRFVISASQPVNPGDSSATVPAFPVQSAAVSCRLDLSDELFGGVKEACAEEGLDRSRCCPVLAAWLFAAHARSALQPAASASPLASDLPLMPDDSQKCVSSLQASLLSRNIKLPQPNATCDTVLCFCGIRLHQISSLSCPAAFNISAALRSAAPMPAVRSLESGCSNSSYAGCTRCLGALQKLKVGENDTKDGNDRASKMFSRDCQLMGLTWLLAKNMQTKGRHERWLHTVVSTHILAHHIYAKKICRSFLFAILPKYPRTYSAWVQVWYWINGILM